MGLPKAPAAPWSVVGANGGLALLWMLDVREATDSGDRFDSMASVTTTQAVAQSNILFGYMAPSPNERTNVLDAFLLNPYLLDVKLPRP